MCVREWQPKPRTSVCVEGAYGRDRWCVERERGEGARESKGVWVCASERTVTSDPAGPARSECRKWKCHERSLFSLSLSLLPICIYIGIDVCYCCGRDWSVRVCVCVERSNFLSAWLLFSPLYSTSPFSRDFRAHAIYYDVQRYEKKSRDFRFFVFRTQSAAFRYGAWLWSL